MAIYKTSVDPLDFTWRLLTHGPCEVCNQPGWKQASIVDPASPLLLTLCPLHHKAYQRGLIDHSMILARRGAIE